MGDERERRHIEEITLLKTIAETINQGLDLRKMLDDALQSLLRLTGLTTGWIFLTEEKSDFRCMAARGLPQALDWGDKAPMRSGTCWCLERYWEGRLDAAVNILNCKRIENAVRYRWGETNGITHHATIPLKAGDKLLGILNVAAPGKNQFGDGELALLQAVAFQIGTAVERLRLYEQEKKRARLLAKAGEIGRGYLSRLVQLERLPDETLRRMAEGFEYPLVAMLQHGQGDGWVLNACLWEGRLIRQDLAMSYEDWPELQRLAHTAGPIVMRGEQWVGMLSARLNESALSELTSVALVPVCLRGKVTGAMMAASGQRMDELDVEALQAVAEYAAIAMENAKVYEQRRDLARMEERNRLARDLHDSVSQMLFSLAMTAGGVETLMNSASEQAMNGIREIRELSQQAHKEMRSMILQLRPAGLEEGLVAGLKRYAGQLGLRLGIETEGTLPLPRLVEEAVYRIGQEGLNNVRKHAGTADVHIKIARQEDRIRISIRDQGRGFEPVTSAPDHSIGLKTIRERTAALGGRVRIESRPGEGTRIEAVIPVQV